MHLPPAQSPTVDLLIEQAAWIRRLAWSLVGDAQLAEDLTQDTWIRVLQHPPEVDRTGRPVRAWLATVMRNLARQTWRGDERRVAREREAARSESVEPGAVVERATVHRKLVEEVLSLDEPYRSTLLLRFFDGLKPGEIARRTDVPLATVKSRLARGLDALRERLDRRSGGDRSAWLSALVPLLGPRELAPATPLIPLSIGAAVMNVKVLGLVLLSAAAGVSFFALRSPEAAAPAEVAKIASVQEPVEPAASAAVSPVRRERSPVVDEREPVAKPAVAAAVHEKKALAAAAPFVVQGRVIDVQSMPVAGVNVLQVGRMRDGEATTTETTGANGSFRLERDHGGRLVVSDERYCTVLAGTPVREGSVIVVAPRIELAGRVVDDAGRPLEGVTVRLDLPSTLRAGIDAILDHAANETFTEPTDEDGHFRFDRAPAVEGMRLRAGKQGLIAYDEPAPQQSLYDLMLVLTQPENDEHTLRGRVVDGEGRPVEDARIAYGLDTTTSDERGRFSFDLDAEQSFTGSWNEIAAAHFDPEDALRGIDTVVAVKPGFLPAEARTPDRDEAGEPVWSQNVTIRLDQEPFSLAGRVVDVDGNPRAKMLVWIADPTFFGGLGDPATDRFPRLTHAESLLAGSADSWHKVTTDEDGHFRIEGLLDRSYRVEAMDPATLLRAQLEDVRAGDMSVTVTLPTDQLYATLRGTVVSHGGRPVEGVEVHPMNDAFRSGFGRHVMGTQHMTPDGKLAVTDEEGRFELTEVPRRLTYLRLDGDDTIPLEWGRHVDGGLEELVGEGYDDVVITVSVRCHFQVKLDGDDPPDRIAMLDAEGNELSISEFQGTGRQDGPRAELTDGRSSTLATGDEARTLVLYRRGVEVDRLPVELNPGETTTIAP